MLVGQAGGLPQIMNYYLVGERKEIKRTMSNELKIMFPVRESDTDSKHARLQRN